MPTLASESNVRLLQVAGSDAFFCEAAKVSFANAKNIPEWYSEYKLTASDDTSRLIRYLLAHRHEAPFEHSLLTFSINTPLFVLAQLVRHRIGVSLSQESLRYVEPGRGDSQVYCPELWRGQSKDKKQGSEGACCIPAPTHDAVVNTLEKCFSQYHELLERGVAKEQARSVLPVGTYTNAIVSFNMRSFLHFLNLRLDLHAQQEIRDLAAQMYDLVLGTHHFDQTIYWWYELNGRRKAADAAIYNELKDVAHPLLPDFE